LKKWNLFEANAMVEKGRFNFFNLNFLLLTFFF